MSMWPPKKALWLVDCFYTGQSPDLRESPRQSPKASQGGRREMSGGAVRKSKRSLRREIPHPQLCEAANLRKAGFWQKRSGPRGWEELTSWLCMLALLLFARLPGLLDSGFEQAVGWSWPLQCSIVPPPPMPPRQVCSAHPGKVRGMHALWPGARLPRLQRWSLHAAVGVTQHWWKGTPTWYLLRVGPPGAMVGRWLWPQCGGCRNDQPRARSSQRAMCEWWPWPPLPGIPWRMPPPDSAKPPIGHKLRDGRQEGLECDGIGRFERPTGVGGVDDEVTESEKGVKDNWNQDRREWS